MPATAKKETEYGETYPRLDGKTGSVPVIYEGEYYDLSLFYEVHPGGEKHLLVRKGKDITKAFHTNPHPHTKFALLGAGSCAIRIFGVGRKLKKSTNRTFKPPSPSHTGSGNLKSATPKKSPNLKKLTMKTSIGPRGNYSECTK